MTEIGAEGMTEAGVTLLGGVKPAFEHLGSEPG